MMSTPLSITTAWSWRGKRRCQKTRGTEEAEKPRSRKKEQTRKDRERLGRRKTGKQRVNHATFTGQVEQRQMLLKEDMGVVRLFGHRRGALGRPSEDGSVLKPPNGVRR